MKKYHVNGGFFWTQEGGAISVDPYWDIEISNNVIWQRPRWWQWTQWFRIFRAITRLPS